MFWFNLHLDLIVWSAGSFAAGYAFSSLRRYTRRKKDR